MSFPVHVPPPPLGSFVAVAHGYRAPASPSGVHRGLPSPYLTLVVELAVPLRITGLGAPVAAHAVVGGLHTTPAFIDVSAPQEGIQYALTPLGIRALLDEALPERLRVETPSVPAEVTAPWRVVRASEGRARVRDVAAHAGWSRRHLSERFRLETGFTPKQAARIARFDAARRRLLARRSPGLVAASCGYADQAHLSREWQALAGCSVRTWLREEFPIVQDFYDVAAGPPCYDCCLAMPR